MCFGNYRRCARTAGSYSIGGYPFAKIVLGMQCQCPWGRYRACSTAERTATNIVIAPIACAHRTAPCSCSLCSCSSCLCSPLLTRAPCSPCSSLVLPALPAPHSCSLLSLLLVLALPALPAPCAHARAPFARSSLRSQLPFRLWRCSWTFPSTTCARYSIFRPCFSALSLAPWTLLLLV